MYSRETLYSPKTVGSPVQTRYSFIYPARITKQLRILVAFMYQRHQAMEMGYVRKGGVYCVSG